MKLAELPSQYLQCRSYGHAWDSITIEFMPSMWIDHMQCERCGTQRRDIIRKSTGLVTARRYTYAEGYCKDKRDKRVGAPEVRKEMYGRVTL